MTEHRLDGDLALIAGAATGMIVLERVVALQDAPVVEIERRPGAEAAGVGAARHRPDDAAVRLGIAAPCPQGALVALRQMLFGKGGEVLVDDAGGDVVAIMGIPVAEPQETIDDGRTVQAVTADEDVERKLLTVVGEPSRTHVLAGVRLAIHQRQLAEAHRTIVHPHQVQCAFEGLVGAHGVAAPQQGFREQRERLDEVGVVAMRASLDRLHEALTHLDHAGIFTRAEADLHLLDGGGLAWLER